MQEEMIMKLEEMNMLEEMDMMEGAANNENDDEL